MVNIILWLIGGAVIGGLTSLIIHRRRSILITNIILGSIGAFVTGYLLLPMLHISTTSFSLPGLLVALVGCIALLAVVNFFVREHTVTNIVMEGKWDLVRRKIHYRWSKITEADVEQINSDHDRLVSLIEERYQVSKVEAEDQLQKFLRAVLA